MPKLNDIKQRLVNDIVKAFDPAAQAASVHLLCAADALIDECRRAASLDYVQSRPLYLAITSEASGIPDQEKIGGKRLTRARVERVLQNALHGSALVHRSLAVDALSGTQPPNVADIASIAASLARIEQHLVVDTSDQEINDATEHIRSHRFKEALAILEHIRKHRWETLDDGARYRVLTNIGIAYQAMEDFEAAAERFLQAKNYRPDHEQARVFEAMAYSLRGDRERAFKCAVDTLRDHPESAVAWTVRIRCAPDSASFDDLKKQIPTTLLSNSNVATALSSRALLMKHYETAVACARRALEDCPDEPEVLFQVGTLILQSVVDEMLAACGLQVSPQARQTVKEAVAFLDRALREISTYGSPDQVARLLLNRATGHRLLEDPIKSRQDVGQAYNTSPTMPEAAIRYALSLWDQRRGDEAIARIRTVRDSTCSVHIDLLYISCLEQRGSPEDVQEAIQILREKLQGFETAETDGGIEYFRALCQILIDAGRHEDAEHLLQDSVRLRIPESLANMLRARIAQSAGNRERANELLTASYESREFLPSADHKIALATQLEQSNLHREAFAVWKEIVLPSALGPYTAHLLNCAINAGEDSDILAFCQSLRQCGFHHLQCLELEAKMLIRYGEYENAVEILRASIPK